MVGAPARQRSQPFPLADRRAHGLLQEGRSRGPAMSDPRIRAKRILTHDVEFERLAESATTAALRAEYLAIAAQYRRLALAEGNRAAAPESAIRQSKRELDRAASDAPRP